MASFGSKEKSCSYDPTINTPKFKYPDIEFKEIGLSGVPRDGIYKLFSYIISENGHYDWSYLKMDIEGDEIPGIRTWLKNYVEMELFARKVGMDFLNDSTFEDMVASLGCNVYAYDPIQYH